MDAEAAIAELTDISPQVRQVVVVGADGGIVGTNVAEERVRVLADGARLLLESADSVRAERALGPTAQLEAATVDGSVFVVRDGDRTIVATTTPEPTVGLVFYDLKTCLRSIEDPKKPRRRAPRKEDDAAS